MSKSAKSAPRKVTRTAAAPAAKTAATDGVPLKRICTELKLEPKAARRKLRAAAPSFHGKRERWVFSPAQAKQAREILSA